ncbi:MAG: thioredoxin family protein [Gammaproteobacteria bacterium]|nr:thioredoxin family protein [Gammaproteobacteria bacterium]
MSMRLSYLLVLGAVLNVHPGYAEEGDLPPVTIVAASDLHHDASIVQQRHLPILLYFASDYCGYCHIVEEEQIKPMLRNRSYDSRVLVRRVNTTGYDQIVYFNGNRMSADQLAAHYHAPMTPTLIFVNADGDEIAPRIVGVSSLDFYGGDLDESINTALKKLRSTTALSQAP